MKTYTTAKIAKMMNVHPNTVILYEKWGHIEEVKRKDNGYRIFTERHLKQMKLARMLIKGDIVKIEFRCKATKIIRAVVEEDNLELALNRAKDYLIDIQNDISYDTVVIKALLERVKNIKLCNHNSYLKTNQIAKEIGVTNDVLIYWERNGLLEISKNEGNTYRMYSEKDLMMATVIKDLRDLNYTSSAIFKLINRIEVSGEKTLKDFIYNSNVECEIVNEFNQFLAPIKEIESNLMEVIKFIQNMIKE